MSEQTINYSLTKPQLTDPVDIRVLNNNFDILDDELKKTVRYDAEQTLTDAQKAQARANIDVPMGVYVGSGEMPENCNVKIDPNGEGLDIWTEIKNYLDELGVHKTDVTLQGTENFNPWFSTVEAGKNGIVFDQEEIVSAWEKVMNNKIINCVLLGSYWLNSGEDPYKIQMSFRRAAAKEREWNGVKLLVLNFLFDGRYVEYDAGSRAIEYIFEVDTENRTAIFFDANSWAIE